MEYNSILQGDALTKLKELPEKSINMCLTSPPYWALRDYGVEGQLGLEPTFDEYINNLCDIFDEVKRVLREDGTCWVNLGDTYFGSGKGVGGDPEKIKESYQMPKNWKRPSRNNFKNKIQKEQLQDKCLTMIPMRFAIEMVHRGWILRNTIIWHKPNAMPSSVKDRFTVDFEYIFLFSKNKKYYFETQYEPYDQEMNRWGGDKLKATKKSEWDKGTGQTTYRNRNLRPNPEGRNKRTVWRICPKPFKESHFAVYPEELCETPIKAGCPEFVCVKCGNPKVLEVEYKREETRPGKKSKYTDDVYINSNVPQGLKKRVISTQIKKGYKPTCNCNAEFTGGIVLDPFFGAGTTGVVALKQNKKFIGIELNPEYIEIADKRLKPYLEQKKL